MEVSLTSIFLSCPNCLNDCEEEFIVHISLSQLDCFLKNDDTNINQLLTQFLIIGNFGNSINNDFLC